VGGDCGGGCLVEGLEGLREWDDLLLEREGGSICWLKLLLLGGFGAFTGGYVLGDLDTVVALFI
jgi:hypothetical protein